MDWAQVLTIVGVNIALIGAMVTIVVWAVGKMDADVKSLGTEIKALNSRLDGHATRIDQLYRMFIDLLKEGRK